MEIYEREIMCRHKIVITMFGESRYIAANQRILYVQGGRFAPFAFHRVVGAPLAAS